MVIIRWIFRTYLRIIYQKNQLGTYIQISNLNINNLKYITSYCNMYKKYINQEKQTDKKIWEIIHCANKQFGCSAKRAWRQNLQEGFAREQLMPTYN